MERSISQKIIRNTIFNAIGRFWGILVALGLTPYIIGHIGVERYGIWAIVGVLTGYFGLLDFGIGTSFVKYIAEFYAKKDYEKINQVINTGFVFYTIFAIFITTAGFIFINPLLTPFNIPKELYNEAVFVFLLGIILFGVSNALGPFGALQGGLQRMDISNKIAIVISIPSIAGTIFFLEKGYGLPGLMVNNAIILVISSLLNIIAAFNILPELKFNPFSISAEMFKKLFGFGYKMQIARISGVVSNQTDKLLITLFLSIGALTFYQLGSSIVYSVMSMSALLVSALMPAFTELEARGDRGTLINGYLRVTKYMTFICAPLFIFLIISAHDIMIIWMGVGYEKSSLIIQILAVGWMINMIAQVAASMCVAIDKPQFLATGSIIIIMLNIFLGIFLIKKFGFSGAAWGTSLAVMIGTIYFLVMLHNTLNISAKKLINITICYFAICIIAALPIFVIDTIIYRFNLPINRGMTLVVLIMRSLVFFSLYFTGVYYKKLFDEVDISFFKQRLPLARSFIEKLSLIK